MLKRTRTVAALFLTLFDTVSADPERAGHGWEGYYFAENGHSSWYDIAHAIGTVLVELGIAPDREPTAFTPDEIVKYWGSELCPFSLSSPYPRRAVELSWACGGD